VSKPFPVHLSAGTEEFIPGTNSGGQGHPVIKNLNGNPSRVTLQEHQREGELGQIESGDGIRYEALTSLPEADDELRHYVKILNDVKTFEQEMSVPPEQAPPGIRRGTSRNMSRHMEKLLKWRVVRLTTQVRAITNYFTVAKRNGTLRLIVDARKINNLMRRVPKMDLPTIQEVLLYLMSNKFFITVDGLSYFYQFRISDEVGNFFCANLAGERGQFTTVAMTRMPMGWCWAPAIAQKTSNTLLRDGDHVLGKAWIDNFIFAGLTREETREKFLRFRDRADMCNVVIDDREPEVLERGEVLGIDVNLAAAEFRMSQSWVEKARALTLKTHMTPRELYEITGNCIWASCVRELPLCSFGDALEIVRRVAILISTGLDWDTPIKFSSAELDTLGRWKARVVKNEWQQAPTEKGIPREEMWTDASSSMWAYTNLNDKCAQNRFSQEQLLWHIFIKEAYAVHRSVEASRGIPRMYRVDNMPLVLAMKRKVSSNKLVNAWMTTWDWENISVEWVSTKIQKADVYTRGEVMQAPKGTMGTNNKSEQGVNPRVKI